MNLSDTTPPPARERITDLLREIRLGNRAAMDQLLPLVYDDLRRLAHFQLLRERPGHTLGTTGLVHETYFRLVDQTRADWQDRAHFFRIASLSMRRVLVDYARQHLALRRGGGMERASLDDDAAAAERSEWLVALDDALDRLATVSERMRQVVECRFFGGLNEDETAEALGLAKRTVQREWARARGWLYMELTQ